MRRIALAAGMLLALAACSGSDGPTEPTAASVVGAYSLQTIAGHPLPAVILQDASGKREVIAGTLSLNQDGTFSDVGTIRDSFGGTVVTNSSGDFGTYSLTGAAVILRYTDGTTAVASVSDRTLRAQGPAGEWVFRR